MLLMPLFILMPLVGCDVNPGKKYYLEAMRLSEWEPVDKKIRLLTLAVNADPNNIIYLKARGLCYFSSGDYQKALDDFSKTVSSKGSGQAYRLYLKGLTEGRLERFKEAKKDFLQAINLMPDNAQFYYGLALTEMMLGNLQDALNAIDKALTSTPGHCRWNYTKSMILTFMSRKKEAIEQFERTVYASSMRTTCYFEGEIEYERTRQYSKADLLTFWHYGGTWLREISSYYYNKCFD